jgi:CRISPR-associated protein Cas2
MTVVVTRNVADRFRGFLASCMCEIAPGVYTAPKMTQGVRERVWEVLHDWFTNEADQAIVMTWVDRSMPGGQAFRMLGVPRKDLFDHDGVFLARRDLNEQERSSLTIEQGPAKSETG